MKLLWDFVWNTYQAVLVVMVAIIIGGTPLFIIIVLSVSKKMMFTRVRGMRVAKLPCDRSVRTFNHI